MHLRFRDQPYVAVDPGKVPVILVLQIAAVGKPHDLQRHYIFPTVKI